jgi:type II secretory pathway component HofQ
MESPAPGGATSSAQPVARGAQRITVEFNATPVKTALDLIARSSDLMILLDSGVTGTVTLTRDNVTAREVLDEVVAACGLKLTRHENGVLRVSAH